MTTSEKQPLTRISEYMEAIKSLPGWERVGIRGFPEPEASNITYYMHTHFALRAFCPPQAGTKMRVLLLPATRLFAANGGRGISLLLRAVGDLDKYAFTIPVTRRYDINRAPKTLLQLPPQQVVKDSFDNVLNVSPDGHFGALVMPLSRDPDVLVQFLELVKIPGLAARILVNTMDRVDAITLCEVLPRLGHRVSGPVVLEDDRENPMPSADFGVMQAWFAVDDVADEVIAGVDAESEHLLNGLTSYWGNVHAAPESDGVAARTENTLACGTGFTMDVDGVQMDGVLTNARFGVCRQSRRLARAAKDGSGAMVDIAGVPPLPEDLVAKLPPAGEPLYTSPKERVLEWINWLGSFDDVLRSEPYRSAIHPDSDTPSDVAQAEAAQEDAPASDAAMPADAPPPAAPARSSPLHLKLPQVAGTVNVAALAANLSCEDDACYAKAIQHVQAWIRRHGFEIGEDRTSLAVELEGGEVAIETDGAALWALRYDDRRAMATGSTWRVEITVIRHPRPAFGLRLSQIRSSACETSPAASGVPAVVRAIATDLGLEDSGYPLRCGVQDFFGEQGGDVLTDMLLSTSRTHPVLVISADLDASSTRLAESIAQHRTG